MQFHTNHTEGLPSRAGMPQYTSTTDPTLRTLPYTSPYNSSNAPMIRITPQTHPSQCNQTVMSQSHFKTDTGFGQQIGKRHFSNDRNRLSKKNYNINDRKIKAKGKVRHKNNNWQSMLCTNPQDNFPKFDMAVIPDLFRCPRTPMKTQTRGRGVPDYEKLSIYDGEYLPLDLQDAMSDDWDLMRPKRTTSDRKRPEIHRPSDISIRDLFPCIGDLFDFMGCSKTKPLRTRVEQRCAGKHIHPQLETVCLDCGYVVDEKTLGTSIRHDAAARVQGCQNLRQPRYNLPLDKRPAALFNYGYGEVSRDWEKVSAYSGYKGWQYDDDVSIQEVESDNDFSLYNNPTHRTATRTPLPRFKMNNPRQFKTRPGLNRRTLPGPDYFDVDDTGYIALPQFDKSK